MASPAPVLPEVAAIIVPPGRSRPARSASSMIASPGRSGASQGLFYRR